MKRSKFKRYERPTSKNHGIDVQARRHLPLRLNILTGVVLVLLLTLTAQLFRLDVLDYKKMEARLNETTQTIVKVNNAPRGEIYDNTGKALVTNQANQAIIYTKKRGITTDEMLKTANSLANYISMPTKNLTTQDKKDYYLANKQHSEDVLNRIPKEELQKAEQSASATYKLQLKYVTDEEIDYDNHQLKAVAIYKKMNGAQTLTPTFIKNSDVSNKEIAKVGEHESQLEGVSTSVDWTRHYTDQAKPLKSILGTVSSETTGLPADLAKEYLKKGYSLNDRVGLSYLEKSYEDTLHGKNGELKIITNNEQEIVEQKTIRKARKGDNIKLTINSDFQDKLAQLVQNYTKKITAANPCSEGAYAVVINPETGAIIGMSGYAVNPKNGKITEDTLGAMNKAFIPGSVVKPATITSGYQNKVISDNETLTDTPIILGKGASAVRKSSVFNRNGTMSLNTVQALTLSSNVYMMQIVFRMLHVKYTPGMTMPDNISPIETLRKTYAEYGLGTSTDVDIEGETKGFINDKFYDKDGNIKPGTQGNMLDLSYGNYDTYSPLQLAQYVSTIVNNGKRVAPHFVEGIYDSNEDGGLGKEIRPIDTKVLNTVQLTDHQWSIIHKGMYQVTHAANGTASGLGNATKFNISAKTGTAETTGYNRYTKRNQDTVNSSIISYVNDQSKDKTKLAVVVVLPKMAKHTDDANDLAKQIYDLYYDTFKYATQN